MGYSPWGHKELDTTEQITTRTHTHELTSHNDFLLQWLEEGPKGSLLGQASTLSLLD